MLDLSLSQADTSFDLTYADVVLKTADAAEFRASRGLCAGFCSTLRTLFEVSPNQEEYTIPSKVNVLSLDALLKWLHGTRRDVNINLTQEQAFPVLKAADYLGMQCWLDNCACHIKLEGDWLTWVELADTFTSADLLNAVLHMIPNNGQISAPDICCKLHSIRLMQAALQFFDKGIYIWYSALQ